MENYHKRHLESKVEEAFSSFPILLLLGARQTGKTTLIRSLYPEIKTYTFDPVRDIYGARNDPDLFLDQVGTPVFLDEIQYAPEVISAIKRRVDIKKQKSMYILSGSQNFSIMKSIKESLAGRVFILELLPLTQQEIENTHPFKSWIQTCFQLFNPDSEKFRSHLKLFQDSLLIKNSRTVPLVEKIWRGGYPGILDLTNSLIPGFFHSYLQTYIERDIKSLANIRSYQDFGAFVQLLCARSGREINDSELGREIDIDRKTAKHWKDLMIHSFLWKESSPFSGNTTKRISGKKKGYMIDTGIVSNLLKFPSPETLIGHPELGYLFETFIFNEIYKLTKYLLPLPPGVSHYRTKSGSEVDLILELNGYYYPIEIKLNSHPNGNDAKGIASFRKTFPRLKIAPGQIVCNTSEPYPLNENDWAIPYWIL